MGAFRTAPREFLHRLMAIPPIRLQLEVLMKSYALRLYRLPRESQLLKRLGGEWSCQREGGLSLPCSLMPVV